MFSEKGLNIAINSKRLKQVVGANLIFRYSTTKHYCQ
jgi:hypothetical protein